MKRKWKIIASVVGVLVISGGAYAGYKYNQRGIVTVQTGRAVRQDITAVVTASGEIKPLKYINIGANAMGRLIDIYVKEGDKVTKNQVVARLESIQAQAEVAAQRAAVGSSQADSAASEAGLRAADENITTAQATVERTKADLQRMKIDFDRASELYKNQLVARQEFDQKKALYDAQLAAVQESEARVGQAKAQRAQLLAQLNSSQRRITQMDANLRRAADILDKFSAYSPINGVVTNLPVRVGETMVTGIQNSPGSTLMTIADMSVITAEVKVDETDIVNVRLDQVADITIDAIPGRTFKGHVIEIGNTAILRSTGLAASQSAISSQEAKDFKVVIAMDNPPEEIRPGLSCTSKIVTATRQKALTIPIQALTVRQKGDLEPERKDKDKKSNAPLDPVAEKARKEEIQGVFVVNAEKAEFRKVETGITGATDIEVLSGLKDGDELITGSYKVIRTLRNETKVKVDNKAPVKTES
ncbi:MAG: efflux RND transporter periplasmic adaptor subunit [Bryobacteraceae bacterium]